MWTCNVTCELQRIDTTPVKKVQSTKPKWLKGQNTALIISKYTCLPYSKQVTHTSSTWDRLRPHTINNNWLHSLKDFPRQKCSSYQYCPWLPPLPAVLWYHIWPLCAQGDFQPLNQSSLPVQPELHTDEGIFLWRWQDWSCDLVFKRVSFLWYHLVKPN